MGRNTDKLYVTQSEHSGLDGRHGSSTGITHKKERGVSRRLPYIYCSLTHQTWTHPVCVIGPGKVATIYDLLAIVPWLQKKGTEPLTGQPMHAKDLLKLNFAKNEQDEFCDPVTMKVFNEHTHVVAIQSSGNVFAFETIQTLNYKPKHWKDLISEDDFTREDVITIQNPHALESISGTRTEEIVSSSAQADQGVLKAKQPLASGSAEHRDQKVRSALDAITRLRNVNQHPDHSQEDQAEPQRQAVKTAAIRTSPINTANYSTGYTAASFTSTGMAVRTDNDRAILTEEQYLLHPKKVKIKGLAIIMTNLGNLDVELWPEHAPKAVYNFVKLSQAGYYDGVTFHRNIAGFMLQGGDPSGRGTGGKSIFGQEFEDEFSSAHSHDRRGLLCMANKGPGTNTSQFFITYDSARHLDKKHTIFGQVIGGLSTLDVLENVPVLKDAPKDPIVMQQVQILLDPFEEFLQKEAVRRAEAEKASEVTEDDIHTWTNRPVSGSKRANSGMAKVDVVGKYLEPTESQANRGMKMINVPQAKKSKTSGGFGDFSGW